LFRCLSEGDLGGGLNPQSRLHSQSGLELELELESKHGDQSSVKSEKDPKLSSSQSIDLVNLETLNQIIGEETASDLGRTQISDPSPAKDVSNDSNY
jgi:hypothetical protein